MFVVKVDKLGRERREVIGNSSKLECTNTLGKPTTGIGPNLQKKKETPLPFFGLLQLERRSRLSIL